MPLSIGVNLRVTGHCNQGGRKYMEDMFSVAYQQSSNDRELEYAFFGIFDGHGGGEAATFAKENLMDIIVKQKNFWSDNDEDVLKAIRDGYVNTHYAMWRELDKWPRTASGLPSTAGTTASIAFIRKGKIYIGHVGDSAIILGYQEKGDPLWKSKALTRDHKPEEGAEMTRIQESGGKVVSKSGVPRVVWNRPRLGHKGPVRRSTHIDEIPFLAVARSLGDLWSYNSELNTFVVSPEPDVKVIKIDVKTYRCLIFGTDGLWNMLSAQAAVAIVQAAERHNEKHLIASQQTGNGQGDVHMWINPSKSLVDRALDRWSSTRLRADNTSVVTLMLDPPGPTHSEILLSQKREQLAPVRAQVHSVPETPISTATPSDTNVYYCPTPCSKPPEPVAYPCPTTPGAPQLPENCPEAEKQPDSSNNYIGENTVLPTEESSSKYSPSKNETTSNENCSSLPQEEEFIQVAEVSSSNVADEHTTAEPNDTIAGSENVEAESSVCEDEAKNSMEESEDVDIDTVEDTEYLLEKKSWLQEVPEAEKFPGNAETADSKPIQFIEPQGPRLRRSIHDNSNNSNINSPLAKRMTGTVMRQTNGRRRHSTGTAQNGNQRQQQRQRRSLTPKSPVAVTTGTYNKLKRSSKVLSEFDQPRVGVDTRHSSECGANLKLNSDETCLKRRTRSEDHRNIIMQDENSPANQTVEQQHNRLRWPSTDSKSNGVLNTSTPGVPERRLASPNSFKRRSLEKKVTPVKAIRRPSISRSNSRLQMRDIWDQGRASRTGASCSGSRRQAVVNLMSSLGDTITLTTSPASAPKRWLRSDTIAATPIKTLRSRNVDITGHTVPAQVAHQYDQCGAVKQNRLLETPTSKLKQSAVSTDALVTPSAPQTPAALARIKATSCPSTTPSAVTPNRIKQSCNVTPIVGSNSNTCVSTSSTPSSTSGSISKRAKTPYNPSARSISTRSRIKRFTK